jgi:phosphoglycolate phosphatase-like HAD superfamily hydrolase
MAVALMVGDKMGDIAAARAAGLGVALLVEREISADADALVRSLADAVVWMAGAGVKLGSKIS